MTTEELARLENNHRIWLTNPTTKEIVKVLQDFRNEVNTFAVRQSVNIELSDVQVRQRMIAAHYADTFLKIVTDFKTLSSQLNNKQP